MCLMLLFCIVISDAHVQDQGDDDLEHGQAYDQVPETADSEIVGKIDCVDEIM